jgi:hypothetical protein
MRVLVSGEGREKNTSCPEHFVPNRERSRVQLTKERVHINVVARENVDLDTLWPVFEAPFPICKKPEAIKSSRA